MVETHTSIEGEHTWWEFVQPDVFPLPAGETFRTALLHLKMIKRAAGNESFKKHTVGWYQLL